MAMIPTKNPAALAGYYLGVGSLIPFLGLILALPALVCGVIGVAKSMSRPEVGGLGHGVIAIILSIVSPVTTVAVLIVLSLFP